MQEQTVILRYGHYVDIPLKGCIISQVKLSTVKMSIVRWPIYDVSCLSQFGRRLGSVKVQKLIWILYIVMCAILISIPEKK